MINGKYKGFLCNQEIIHMICKIAIKEDCLILKDIIERTIFKYNSSSDKGTELNVEELINYINKLQIEEENNKNMRIKLFSI